MSGEVERILELYEQYKKLINNLRRLPQKEYEESIKIAKESHIEIMNLLDTHKTVRLPNGRYLYYDFLELIELECLNED